MNDKLVLGLIFLISICIALITDFIFGLPDSDKKALCNCGQPDKDDE